MSLDALRAYEDSASESSEEAAAQWNGEVWEDANKWCKALLGLCNRVFGDDCKSGGEPYWGAPNDTAFLAMEEYRRGLPDHCLHEFAKLPYYSELVSRLRSILLAGVQPYLHFYLALVKSSANGTRTRSFGLASTQARCACCLLAKK